MILISEASNLTIFNNIEKFFGSIVRLIFFNIGSSGFLLKVSHVLVGRHDRPYEEPKNYTHKLH